MTISGKQASQAFLFSSLSTEASRSQIAQQFFAEQERSFVSFSREEEFELHARFALPREAHILPNLRNRICGIIRKYE